MFQSGKRILTFFFTLAMVLSGVMAGLFVSSWHDKISPKAIVWYNTGISVVNPDDQFAYIIDKNEMVFDGVNGYCVNGSTTPGLAYVPTDTGLCMVLNGTVWSPDTKAKYKPGGSDFIAPPFGGLHYDWTVSDFRGYYMTDGGNLSTVRDLAIGDSTQIYFTDAVYDYKGQRYGLFMTISNIRVALQNSARRAVAPKICGSGSDGKFWFFAQDWIANDSNVGVSFDVDISVNGASSGKILNTWIDLDQGQIIGDGVTPRHRYYGMSSDVNPCLLWSYQESISPLQGCWGNVYTNPNTWVVSYTCPLNPTGGDIAGSQNAEGSAFNPVSSASFVGDATGYKFRWAGSVCGTAVGTDPNDPAFERVTTHVNVSYMDMNGNWGAGIEVTPASVLLKGSPYYFYWSCNDLLSSPIYKYPEWSGGAVTANVVNDPSVMADTTYTIYVPRRWYNYYFDFDACIPPDHDSSEIGNKQQTITKLAENWSGDVINPTLTGYTFLGFSDSKASGFTNSFYGNPYASSQMLSDKVFYAQWRRNKYKVIYNANGGTNFNHLDGEYTQNETGGHMNESTFEYGVEGKLRKNTYTREGYTFMGWRKERSGTGTLYKDEYDEVFNWSSQDGGSVVLYAQWRKNFGAETLTVVSEETGNPVAGVTMKLQKKKNGTWTDMGTTATTGTDGKISARNLHWFDYRWVMTAVPTGYMKNTETPSSCYSSYPSTDFKICPCRSCGKAVCDKFSVKHNVILYMKHANITITSVVDCILDGEDPPAFIYRIRGNDVAGVQHEYYITTPVNRSTKTGVKTLVHDIFAGEYTISRLNVSRYVPKEPYNLTNMTRSGMNAVANVKENSSASASFPYTLTNHGWYYGVDNRSNALRK